MTRLFSTTAMVLALGLPALAFADTNTSAATTAATAEINPQTSGFLAARSANQLLATDLIGHDVYARRTPIDMATNRTAAANGAPMAVMTAKDTEAMDKVGKIADLVLANDGSIAAVVIGVGGFLGVGQRDVAVAMNEVSFAVDAKQTNNLYVVLNTSGEMLKSSPPFDKAAAAGAAMTANTATNTDQTTTGNSAASVLRAPQMTREGYNTLKVSDISVDKLIGKKVYGKNDDSVGTVSDVKVDAAGSVQKVIIDFGGFLGMGTTKVALTFDELTILSNADNTDIRVYVDATKDQIKAMPVYTTSD